MHIFDHLVIATNANQAANLVKDLSFTEPVRTILNQVEYFQTTIAVHGDESLMPTDRRAWSLVNTRYDGRHSSYTIYKPWLSPQRSIFKSWVTYDTQLPENRYATTQYLHAKVNRAYFKTQQALPAYQGQNNLWFGGLYTHDVDCHESAIMSGVNIARQIEPQSTRLKKLQTN
jgi:predicted NAD/FAD-binding protein